MERTHSLVAPMRYYPAATHLAPIGQQSEEKSGVRSPVFRHFVSGTLFVLVTALIFAYWVGFPLANTLFVHGYPRFGSPPHPNLFKSARYTWDWWHVWALSLNGLLPLSFMMALADNRVQEYARLHVFLAAFVTLADAWCVVALWVRSCFWCNVASSYRNTACNDYRWCGVYYNAAGEAPEWCANTTPFVPAVAASDLRVNAEYTQHIVFAAVFCVIGLFYLGMAAAMARWGVFSNEPPEEEDWSE